MIWKERRKRKDSQNEIDWTTVNAASEAATTEKLLLIIYCMLYLTSVAAFNKFCLNSHDKIVILSNHEICKFIVYVYTMNCDILKTEV